MPKDTPDSFEATQGQFATSVGYRGITSPNFVDINGEYRPADYRRRVSPPQRPSHILEDLPASVDRNKSRRRQNAAPTLEQMGVLPAYEL